MLRGYGPWAAVVIIPLLVNIILWRALAVPQQARLREWRATHLLAELKPKLDATLAQAQQALTRWRQSSFATNDSSAIMPAIQRLAERHHVEVKKLNVNAAKASADQAAAAAGKTVAVEIEASGRFSQLGHWISDIENQAGLQVDSWELFSPAKANDQTCRLTVKMTAFLGGA